MAWIINEISKSKGSDNDLIFLRNHIDWLCEEHFHMEQEILFNIRTSIKYAGDENRENVDSIFSEATNKQKRKPLLNILKNVDYMYKHHANSYLTRLSKISNTTKSEDDNKALIEYFIKNHRAAFEKIRVNNKKMVGDKNINLGSSKNINDISDVLIIMGINPSKNNVLVTREGENIEIIKNVGLGEWVISQDEYFDKIKLEELKNGISFI